MVAIVVEGDFRLLARALHRSMTPLECPICAVARALIVDETGDATLGWTP